MIWEKSIKHEEIDLSICHVLGRGPTEIFDEKYDYNHKDIVSSKLIHRKCKGMTLLKYKDYYFNYDYINIILDDIGVKEKMLKTVLCTSRLCEDNDCAVLLIKNIDTTYSIASLVKDYDPTGHEVIKLDTYRRLVL